MVAISDPAEAPAQRIDLASIIESLDDPIVGLTPAGVISSCNRAAGLLYGYGPQELIGRAAEVLVPVRFRDEEAATLRRAGAGEKVPSHRLERLRRDGSTVTVIETYSPIRDSADEIIGTAAIAHPVPEIQSARAGGPPSYQPQLDGETTTESFPASEAHNRAGPELDPVHQQERSQVRQAQDRLQLRMDEERAQERVAVRRAQDRFQARIGLEWSQERVRVEQAQDRFQVVMETERNEERIHVEQAQDRFQLVIDAGRAQAQADSEQLQAQLYEGQRLEALGHLAGGVAHDFNNVLAVILNFAGFVSEALTSGSEAELLAAGRDVEQIQRAAERASGLTRQLLAFARREVIRPRVIDLNHIVADVEQMLRRTIGADIVLTTELAADLCPVLADAGQIEQVLVNLAVNARDAMARGGTLRIDTTNIVVNVATSSLLVPGRYVRLRIEDTGTGMPAETRDRVFEPFFTTKAEGHGTGLGLSTVYGIVTQAGGAITIDSEVGAGTTFTILLPVTDEVEPIEETAVAPDKHTPAGATVLIVEDQDALREVTERIFSRAGYHVLTAENGARAAALAAEHDGEIHLLLTDVVMPTMPGKEAAELIRRSRPDIEVLFMSGYARPVLAAQGRLDPDVNLIEKPFTGPAIIEKAGRILHGYPQTDPAGD